MSEDRSLPSGEDGTSAGDDWDRRILCSDGNCIGVIGPDGRCKECGKLYDGELPERGARDPDAATTPPAAVTLEEEAAEKAPAEAPAEDAAGGESLDDDDWDRRTLCSDGNCIGVIGADGRCTTCGKPYDPDAGQ